MNIYAATWRAGSQASQGIKSPADSPSAVGAAGLLGASTGYFMPPPVSGTGALFYSVDGDRVEISAGLMEALEAQAVCQTCEDRKYVDNSDDPSVSFQTPTNISPNMAAAAVMSHEQEHVRNEQAKAHRDNREIVNQSVTLQYDTCPECGKQYVSGGTTRTTSRSRSENNDEEEFSIDPSAESGDAGDEE